MFLGGPRWLMLGALSTTAPAMSEIVILTPHDIDSQTEASWRDRLQRVTEPLRNHGFTVHSFPWSTSQDLHSFAAVLPLLAWGYHRESARWLAQLDHWTRTGVKLLNSAAVLRANSDKRYLAHFEHQGVAIVPSSFHDKLSRDLLLAALKRWQCAELVIKPTISAGAFHTQRLTAAQLDAFEVADLACGWIVQPYLPEIAESGEWSLIYFNKRFSHAVWKRPCAGEFRVQEGFGGNTQPGTPTQAFFAAADAVLAAIPEVLYARVDLTMFRNQVVLMELEAIEPDLFLGYDAEASPRFAQALWETLHTSR